MKKVALLLLVPFFVAISACAPARIAPPTTSDERVRTEFFEPKIGEVSKREVGESLLRKGVATTTSNATVTLLEEASSSIDLGHRLYAASGTSRPLQFGSVNKLKMICLSTGGVGSVATGAATGCLVDTKSDGQFDQSMFAGRDRYFPLAAPARYKVEKLKNTIENAADFHVEVLFQGVSKGEVKISYREFKGGIARPAFTQDVSYEIEKDGTAMIAFKGMRIKVLKANGQEITYVVEKPPTT